MEENDSSAFDELGRLGEEMDFISVEKVSSSGKQGKRSRSEKIKSTEKRIQYATRGKKHSYCEAEVPDDDHYICELNLILVTNYDGLQRILIAFLYVQVISEANMDQSYMH